MLSALLGDIAELLPLKRLIIEKTEGNPLFMEELVEALLEEGVLVRNGAIKLTRPLSQLKIPPTVQGILAARIDRLPPEEKELLQTLAVIGMEFPLLLVREVVLLPPEQLDRSLRTLQSGEFIYEQPAASNIDYTFKHALIQEVAYGTLLVERRKALHERIGAAIETTYSAQLDDYLNDLARHYSRSLNTEKAAKYLERAGRRATIHGAFKEAEIHFQKAIAFLRTRPETPPRIEHEFNLQLALVGLLANTSGFTADETELAVQRLKELSGKIDNPGQLIFTLGATWATLLGRGEQTAAQQIADQMLEIAEQTGSRSHRTTAHLFEAQSHLRRGNLKHAMQHYEAVLVSYRQDDFSGWPVDPKANALGFGGLGWWHLGMPDRARASIREAISWAERISSPSELTEALGCASHLYIDLLDPEEVQMFADRQLALAREVGLPAELELSSAFRGWAIAQQGRAGEGCALIHTALDSTLARGTKLNVPQFLYLLSSAQAHGGRLEEALTSIERALSAVGEQEFSVLRALWQRGEIHRQMGDEAESERDFRAAIAAALRMGSKAYELRATTSLARLLRDTNRRDEARARLAEIYNWFTEGFDTADLKDAKALVDELSRLP